VLTRQGDEAEIELNTGVTHQGNTRFYRVMRLESLCLELASGAIALGFAHFKESFALARIQTFTAASGGLA